ncbi:MAG: PorT family protein [Prevotella sp.]|nr:PorT family protein [Prevotella sp.]
MKKIIMTMLLGIAATFAAQAQSQGTSRWTITPHVGVNSSNMSGQEIYYDFDHSVKSGRRLGLVAGAEVSYRYVQPLSTAVGVWYSREGFSLDFPAGESKSHFDFLNFSAVENFYVTDGLAIKAGLQLGYMLSGESALADGSSQDLDKFYKKVNISVPVGVSYEYRQVVLDLRYNIGLTNLCDVELLNETWRTNSLWLTLGYQFDL